MQQIDNISIRKITHNDTQNIVKWRNCAHVRNNFLYSGEFTEEIHNNWMKKKVEKGHVVQFIILENDMPVGSTFLRDIDYENMKAEFGIFIGEFDALGKGIGQKAIKLILSYGFSELKLHKISLRVISTNQAAINSYKKVGFKHEALLEDEQLKNDKYIDIILMAIINKE